jgi:hypothetical protein
MVRFGVLMVEDIKVNESSPHLLTYPRSGSHFFEEEFYKKTGQRVSRSHTIVQAFDGNKNKLKKIVTIIRDPKDSISSLLTLQKKYGNPVDKHSINQALSDYVLLYQFFIDYADYVIDFNDLVEYPELVINKIMEHLKINKKSEFDFDIDENFHPKKYFKSSQILPYYEEINLDGFNLELCYYEYNRILPKKIIIDKN